MDYLRKKYAGYKEIGVVLLQHELLLSDLEYKAVKREVSKMLGNKRCPEFIELDVFERVVVSHL